MHSPKLVSLAIFYVCVWRVSVINVVLLLVTVVTLPWPLVSLYLSLSFSVSTELAIAWDIT